LKEISKILGKPSEQARASKNSSQQCEIIFFEIVENNSFSLFLIVFPTKKVISF